MSVVEARQNFVHSLHSRTHEVWFESIQLIETIEEEKKHPATITIDENEERP